MTTTAIPDNTAVRVALWRALHVEVDPPPHVLVDEIGLQLAAPDDDGADDDDDGWRQRPDMDPAGTSRSRASIVVRSRFVEDLVTADKAPTQYVILGAGLDTFAQRRPGVTAARVRVFEVDQPATQAWKQQRLAELGLDPPVFVPVDFESGASSWDGLVAAGFDPDQPTVVAFNGVTMYLTADALASTLRQAVRTLASGSIMVMSFFIPLDQVDADEQPALRGAERGARAAGTPWLSFFTPGEITDIALEAGFDVTYIRPADLAARYFSERTDGLRPSSAEHLLVATTS